MLAIDLLLLACFIPAIIKGVSKGLVKQIVSLLSIFVGAWCAFRFSSIFTEWLGNYIQADAQIMNIVSFSVIVIAVILVLSLLGNLITKVVNLTILGSLNKVLGFLFAILETAMILGLLILVFEAVNDKFDIVGEEVLKGSKVYVLLRDFASFVFPYLKKLVTNA